MQQKKPVASIVNHIGLKHASMVNITCPTHGPHTVMRAQLPDGQWYTGRCPICSAQDVAEDTGYFPVDKEAQERRRVINAIEDAKIPPLYRSYTFEAYKVVDGMTMNLSYQCKQLLAGHVQNLVLTGKTDTGKSHLLVATLIEAIRQGRSVRYTTEVDMLAEIKEAFHLYGSDRKAMQTFSDYDVLAIDEIGKAKETDYNVSALFTIIDKRRVNLKATLYAGNMELEELKTYFTDPMVRRIKESGMFLNVGASDWRNAQ